MDPLTGNLYTDVFYDQGRRYVDHAVDCSKCGREMGIDHGFRRGSTVSAWIKKLGWRKHPEHGKWVCPECVTEMEKS